MATKSSIRVGVLLPGQIQFLDIAAVDLLGILTPEYLRECSFPEETIQRIGVNFEFLYIAEKTEKAGELSAGARLVITHSPEEVDRVDILIAPGPDPELRPSPVIKAFVQKCHADPATTILSICSGAIPLARSGIFSGSTVTTPRWLIPKLKEELPDVDWVAKRWVKDPKVKSGGGELWSSGVILNGMDMIVAYITEKYGEESAKVVCDFTNFNARGQEFDD